jgi:DNA-binding transcriptional LysR family regulator
MDVHQLATLREVAQHGSVTAAARILHCTPSAVSQQLKALERAAGVPLVERAGRGIRLTGAGHALARSAVEVAVALERAQAAVTRFAAETTGSVTITAFQSAAELLFPDLVTRVLALGGIGLECNESDVAQSEFAALTAEYDLVLAHRPDRSQDWPASVKAIPLFREPVDVALPLSHRLAGQQRVQVADLAGESWIAVRTGFPLAELLTTLAARSGQAPRIAHRINDFHVVEAMVARGHGIALLPRYSAGDRTDQHIVLKPLAGARPGRQIDLLVRPDRAERLVVRAVITELRQLTRTIRRP